MILRPYQSRHINNVKAAIKKHGNTLGVAATGAGKTIMMAHLNEGKTLVLQHRQELVYQNMDKFLKVNQKASVSVFDSINKSFRGKTVFAMQQSIVRALHAIPKFDRVIIDECHHCISPTYQKIIDRAYEVNPELTLLGLTATPERGDGKSLRKYFTNCADQVSIRELVGLGYLVPPKAFVVEVATEALAQVKSTSNFGDQKEVASILNSVSINDEVVRNWKEKADGRKTIVFCATVQHAEDVASAFNAAGIKSECVHGQLPDGQRKQALRLFDNGKTQVVTNVAVLVEGFDSQPVSCIILLRKCSEKGPLIQMVGRGLRIVDPEMYPDIAKSDCVVMDFGSSILTHGNLDQIVDLNERVASALEGEAVTKICPESYEPGMVYHFPDGNGNIGCGAEIPAQTKVCPICGFVFQRLVADKELFGVELCEIDILNASPFRWCDLFGNDLCLVANGFSAWAGVFSPDHGTTWVAIGYRNEERKIHKLAVTGRAQAMAMADDFLRRFETDTSARKSKAWLNDPATQKQIELLNRRFDYGIGMDIMGNSGYTKYSAACHASFSFSRREIEKVLGVA